MTNYNPDHVHSGEFLSQLRTFDPTAIAHTILHVYILISSPLNIDINTNNIITVIILYGPYYLTLLHGELLKQRPPVTK